MWFLLVFIAHTELLLVSRTHGKIQQRGTGEERLILRGGQDPCHGHVEIFYRKVWGFVGDQDWNSATEKVVCESTHCGLPVEGATEDVLMPLDSKVWLNEVKCNGSEKHLFDCDYPGQGISFYRKRTVKKVKCSHKIKISLDGFKCAGAVQFSVNGETQPGYFCAEHWDQKEADSLCRSLNCGVSKETSVHDWIIWTEFKKSRKMKLDCGNIEPVDNLWQCVSQDTTECKHPASVVCTDHKRLQLRGNTKTVCSGQLEEEKNGKWVPFKSNKRRPDAWCQQMNCGVLRSHSRDGGLTQLTCSDDVSVVLMDRGKPSQCYGAVHVNVNGTTHAVCASTWTRAEAEVTCRELNCGKVITYEKKSAGPGINKVNSTMDNVRCLGSESSLWHCQAARDKDMQCSTTAYVVCTDDVSVVLMDRSKPSQCYGAVHVNVNGATRAVCASTWTRAEAEVTCRELNCGKAITYEKKKSAGQGIMDNVSCLGSESLLWHCPAARDRDMQCSTTAYVVCTGSLDVRLADAPGKCAGRVEILHEGEWRQVSADQWTDHNSDVVCRQLNCGQRQKSSGPERRFGRNSADFLPLTLNCSQQASRVRECFSHVSEKASRTEAVGITCDHHKVLILEGGNNSCSGLVGIVSGNGTYWLSGSETTWTRESADAVCRQMHCGKALNFSASTADIQAEVWDQSYNCSSAAASLFDCSAAAKSRDHKLSRARVTCSGTITVNMTDGCWGTVSVFLDGHSGGVCADSWSHAHSATLCQSLGCGHAVASAQSPAGRVSAMVKRLYATNRATCLSCSSFVMNSERHQCSPAYAICSGSIKPRMSISRGRCSGKLEFFSEGQWLPVCTSALQQKQAQHAVCEELHCGGALDVIDNFGPKPATNRVISNVQCSNTGAKSLSECNVSSANTQCSPAGLRCSDWRTIEVSKTCRGAASVHSHKTQSPVAIDGWTETEGQRLCQDLKCGGFKSREGYNNSQQLLRFWNGSFSCEKDVQNIWDCEKPASSAPTQQLFIECEDKPNVTLSGKCQGLVAINGVEVCDSNWNFNDSQSVCHEQKCGNAIVNSSSRSDANADYYHVRCDHLAHHDLGQCMRVQEKCDSGLVSVYCVGSVEFRTSETCGGKLSLHYQNDWVDMCPLNLSTAFKDQLCRKISCGGYKDTYKRRSPLSHFSQLVTLNMALDCTDDHNDIKYCVTQRSCEGVRPAHIYCKGYKDDSDENENKQRGDSGVVPIILAVGLCLALIIVIAIFIQICVVKKVKNFCKSPERKVATTEMEFDSGDYEEVSKSNEREDSRFRSEAEFAASESSYDDVDETVEAQPLTAPHAQDSVTYEVDDTVDNYDDIEAAPVVTRTAADVHHRSPNTSGEGGAVAPPGSVQEEGDYVLPEHDEG